MRKIDRIIKALSNWDRIDHADETSIPDYENASMNALNKLIDVLDGYGINSEEFIESFVEGTFTIDDISEELLEEFM
jgi:hypothetical protein